MQKRLRKLFPWQIRWKGVLLESALFLAAYIAWAIFSSPQNPARLFIGSLAVLVPGAAAVLFNIRVPAETSSRHQSCLALPGLGAGMLVAR